MEVNHREYLCIRDDELFTLLATLGVENWYGLQFESEQRRQCNPNAVINSLYQKGYIELEDETIKVSEELSLIISSLISSKRYLYLRKPGLKNIVCSYYLSDTAAVSVEKSVVEETTYKVSIMDLNSLKQIIMSCFDNNISENEEKENEIINCFFDFNEEITEEDILRENYTTVIEKYNTSDGKKTDRVVIQDAGLYYRLFLQNATSDICMENSKEKQEFICKKMLET